MTHPRLLTARNRQPQEVSSSDCVSRPQKRCRNSREIAFSRAKYGLKKCEKTPKNADTSALSDYFYGCEYFWVSALIVRLRHVFRPVLDFFIKKWKYKKILILYFIFILSFSLEKSFNKFNSPHYYDMYSRLSLIKIVISKLIPLEFESKWDIIYLITHPSNLTIQGNIKLYRSVSENDGSCRRSRKRLILFLFPEQLYY